MTNLEKYTNIFINVFSTDVEELRGGFCFKEIERWDSLIHLTLISELEENFGVLFDTDDILNFGSYENGIKILSRYGVDFNA